MDTLIVLAKNVVLSALHGWVGASLAVFMFFRPLTPWRIFGVRIWHGVIPAQQERIGAAISEVVADELLTPGAMLEYMERESALERWISVAIHETVQSVSDRDYAGVVDLIPPSAVDIADDIKKRTGTALAQWTWKFLKEPETEDLFKEFLHNRLESLWPKQLSEFWSEEQAQSFITMFMDKVELYLIDPRFRQLTIDLMRYAHQSLSVQEIPLKEFLPQPLLDKINQWPAELAEILPELVSRLQENDEIMDRLTIVILDVLEHLKEQSGLARIGIGLFQFFSEYQKEVEMFVRRDMFPRMSEFLSSPEIKTWLEKSIREQAESILSRPVSDLANGITEPQLDAAGDWLAERLGLWLREASTRAWLHEFLLERYKDLADQRLDELFRRYARLEPEQVEDRLAGYGINLLNRPGAVNILESVAGSLIDGITSYPIGRLSDRLAPETLTRIEETAVGMITSYLQNKVPAFLEQIDLKAIVKEKIESYSTKELVEMFQKVTMNSLQKIEIYGAVIGAVMGIFIGLANLHTEAFGITAAALAAIVILLRMGKG